jgi:predicted benzoate:H+ symporter BenE
MQHTSEAGINLMKRKKDNAMADDPVTGLISYLDAMMGGAATTILAAVAARIAVHGQEVRKRTRQMVGMELIFEPPIAVGMALVGDSLAGYMGWSHHVSVGVVAVLAYLGPRGAQVMLDRWLGAKIGGKE